MRKVSYRLPSSLRAELKQSVVAAYGPKGKSAWIREAVKDLVKTDPRLTLVGVSEALNDNDAADIVNFDEETWGLFEHACVTVRRQDPMFQGVRSAVIRAAIRRRLSIS